MTAPAAYEWAVQRPNGTVEPLPEKLAKAYFVFESETQRALGRNYRLLRRPVAEWQDVTDAAISQWSGSAEVRP